MAMVLNNSRSDLDRLVQACLRVKVNNLAWVPMVSLYHLSLLVNNKSSMPSLPLLLPIDKSRDRDRIHRVDRFDHFPNKTKEVPCKVNNEFLSSKCSKSKLR
jgi:hypothetical protein